MAGKYLPKDIVLKIIAKLPAKPLLRFKCVSTHWNHVISEADFLKSRSRRMILFSLNPFQTIHNKVLGNDSGSSVVTLVKGKHVDLVGTVNGLVLLVVHGEMILYNPFSAALYKIPNPPSHRSYNRDEYVYGFGYGTTPNDLKIVRIIKSSHKGCLLRSCDIYSLVSKSWKKPLELMGSYIFNSGNKGVFVNGCLYWNVCKRRKKRGKTRMLLALDVKEMIFSEIQDSPPNLTNLSLGTFKGRLCMICSDRNSCLRVDELWVMNEHGLRSSFSKVGKLPSEFRYHIMMSKQHVSMSMSPMVTNPMILDDGKIVMLLVATHELISYDMLNDLFKTVKTTTHLGFDAIEYVETCVSPSLLFSDYNADIIS